MKKLCVTFWVKISSQKVYRFCQFFALLTSRAIDLKLHLKKGYTKHVIMVHSDVHRLTFFISLNIIVILILNWKLYGDDWRHDIVLNGWMLSSLEAIWRRNSFLRAWIAKRKPRTELIEAHETTFPSTSAKITETR